MTLHKPDITYIKAKEVIENLDLSEKDVLIKYYIEKHKEWHEKDKNILSKYYKFFETLNNFLPKSGRRYG